MVFAEKTHIGYIKYMNVKVYSNCTLVCGHITDTTFKTYYMRPQMAYYVCNKRMFLTIELYSI